MNQEQELTATGMTKYDPAMINRLKKDIIQDLETRREWQEEYYGEPGYGAPPARGGYRTPPMPMYNRQYPDVNYDWWTDRDVYQNQRDVAALKNQLRTELMNLDKMNRRIGQVRDPLVRQALVELLQEARQQGAGVPDLIQSLNTANQVGAGSMVDRLTAPLKGIDRRSFGWGIGAALLGLTLLPSLTKSLRSFTGGDDGRSQNIFDMAREEFEGIVAEAKAGGKEDTGKVSGKK